MTVRTEPCSPDHRSVIAALEGFTFGEGGGLCTVISAVPRPVRAAMDEERAEAYELAVAAPHRRLAEEGHALVESVDSWPGVRGALDMLGLGLEFDGERLEEVAAAALKWSGQWEDSAVKEAHDKLRELLDGGNHVDLAARCKVARASVSKFLKHAIGEMNDALGEARSGAVAKATPKKHGVVPDVDCNLLQELLGVADAAARVEVEASQRIGLKRKAAELTKRAMVLPLAPSPDAEDAAWAAWVATVTPQAQAILAQAGEGWRGGIRVAGPRGPEAGQGSLRLGLDDMMGAMGPDNGGGAIDALLIEFDPDTGRRASRCRASPRMAWQSSRRRVWPTGALTRRTASSGTRTQRR